MTYLWMALWWIISEVLPRELVRVMLFLSSGDILWVIKSHRCIHRQLGTSNTIHNFLSILDAWHQLLYTELIESHYIHKHSRSSEFKNWRNSTFIMRWGFWWDVMYMYVRTYSLQNSFSDCSISVRISMHFLKQKKQLCNPHSIFRKLPILCSSL